ncbi:MAG: hypothetical protein AAGA70_16545 [Pseudomonadota bacterium]
MIRALAISLLLAPAAEAQSEAEAAALNMGLAVDLCLQELADQDGMRDGLAPRFDTAGFTLIEFGGGYEFTGPGVFGYLSPSEPEFFCSVQSALVPMDRAGQIAYDRVLYRFPGGVAGLPQQEARAGCPIMRYTAYGLPHRLQILSAGNSGECYERDSAAILFGAF